jgi:hypothetical protein
VVGPRTQAEPLERGAHERRAGLVELAVEAQFGQAELGVRAERGARQATPLALAPL